MVTTLAGNGTAGFTDGPGTNATFGIPYGLTVDSSGNVWVADFSRIRKIDSSGFVSTLAGGPFFGYRDGTGSNARFSGLAGITIGPDGNIYVTESLNNRIRKVTLQGVVSTLAGNGIQGNMNDSLATSSFYYPWGIVFDTAGNIILADSRNNQIRKLNLNSNFNRYLWSNGETSQTINVKASGNYAVQTIKGSCTSVASIPIPVSVTSKAAPSINASSTNHNLPNR